MTKYILAAIAAATIYSCSPKMKLAKNETTDAGGNKMLLGLSNKKMLTEKPYGEWFNKNLDDYTTDTAVVNQLKGKLKDAKFTIFMGTWCGDSKREVPRIYKVLLQAGIKEKQITLVTVNNSDSAYKQSPTHEERGLNIHRVPTLIMYYNNLETGRIIESPVQSWEKDMLAISKLENYKPRYAGAEYLENYLSVLSVDELEKDSTVIAARLKPLLKNEYEVSAYARVKRANGEVQKAIFIAQLNTMIFGDKADAWYLLGANYQAAGNKTAAAEQYKKALLLKPDHQIARKKLEELAKF
jgi:tetratricopeptide (TPR) repeat protein